MRYARMPEKSICAEFSGLRRIFVPIVHSLKYFNSEVFLPAGFRSLS